MAHTHTHTHTHTVIPTMIPNVTDKSTSTTVIKTGDTEHSELVEKFLLTTASRGTLNQYYYTYMLHIESLMSCHLLLNVLHELANMILCENTCAVKNGSTVLAVSPN